MNITIYDGKPFKHIGCVWDPGGSLGMTASYPLFFSGFAGCVRTEIADETTNLRYICCSLNSSVGPTPYNLADTLLEAHPNRPPSSAQFCAVCSSSAQFTQFALRTQQFGAV